MKVGYARTSTLKQEAGLEAQDRDLRAKGVEKIFTEQVSSVDARRAELTACIEFCREGDVLYVTKLDRLARSVADLVGIEKQLKEKSVGLVILSLAIDTTTPAGRLQFNIFASVAQFEREIMLERQREGIAKAQREGKYKGRPATAMASGQEILADIATGMSIAAAARKHGISERSAFRIVAASKEDN